MVRKKKEMKEQQKDKEQMSEEQLQSVKKKSSEKSKIDELEQKVSELEKEKEAAKNRYMRTLAEFENFRRRNAQERINWIRNANEGLIRKLCDVLDDFERAFLNQIHEKKSENIYQGMEAIYRKLQTVLKTEGVMKIETEEREFDPMYHDAISYTSSHLDKDRIVAVIENGYIMNNKVIRPAKVILSSGDKEPDSQPEAMNEDKNEKYID